MTESGSPEANALIEAKRAVGGNTALARLIGGITPQAISQWRKVPIERLADVEAATGIPREQLRPDVFGPAVDTAGREVA